jgi:hypothetical protein
LGFLASTQPTSTASRKSKVKSQKSKLIGFKLFSDSEWPFYLRRSVPDNFNFLLRL